MRKAAFFASVALSMSCLAGCFPEELVFWSPDGKVAAIRGGETLYFCDGDGKILASHDGKYDHVAWMSDSKSFVGIRSAPVKTWDELVKLMDDDQRKLTVDQAEKWWREFKQHQGDMKSFKPSQADDIDVAAAGLYLRLKYPKELVEKLGQEQWEQFASLYPDSSVAEVLEFKDGKAVVRTTVWTTIDSVDDIAVSRDGKKLAMTISRPGAPRDFSLLVLPLQKDSRPLRVAQRVAMQPGWSDDSRSVLYEQRVASVAKEGDLSLGKIMRQNVYDEKGTISVDLAEPVIVAYTIFGRLNKAAALGEETALFSGASTTLPSMDPPSGESLYVVKMSAAGEGRDPIRPLLKDAEAVPESFRLSPNRARAVFLVKEFQKVAVVTIADGKVVELDLQLPENRERNGNDRETGVPNWRNDEEVCVRVRRGSKLGSEARSEVILWNIKTGKTRIISADWPAELAKAILDPSKEAEPTKEERE